MTFAIARKWIAISKIIFSARFYIIEESSFETWAKRDSKLLETQDY